MGRQRSRAPQYGGESVRQFLKGFHSDATKEAYSRKLFQFAESCGMTPDGLLAEANRDPKPLQRLIVDYIERRKSEVSGSTINITVSALKHFFEMNDAEQSVNWAKVSRPRPQGAEERKRQGPHHGGDKADGAGGRHPHPVRHPDVRQLRDQGGRL